MRQSFNPFPRQQLNPANPRKHRFFIQDFRNELISPKNRGQLLMLIGFPNMAARRFDKPHTQPLESRAVLGPDRPHPGRGRPGSPNKCRSPHRRPIPWPGRSASRPGKLICRRIGSSGSHEFIKVASRRLRIGFSEAWTQACRGSGVLQASGRSGRTPSAGVAQFARNVIRNGIRGGRLSECLQNPAPIGYLRIERMSRTICASTQR
jgi:hypothetical protein